MLSPNALERRLQIAGILVILGLLVEASCMFWARPLAFVLFVFVGVTFLGAGLLLYLYSVVSVRQ
ncbi:MAG: hypothetical protein JSS69_01230 [Acidobacteria bacterium]|nr:hypothetical protein [Acidobacteriota bacterium]MBS1864516.1 hypothetical protein [Acidobacteriota bacterium]